MANIGAQTNTSSIAFAHGDTDKVTNIAEFDGTLAASPKKWLQLPFVNLPGFGASVAVRPDDSIDNTRQRKRGAIVDLNAGVQIDGYLSQSVAEKLLPLFLLSKWKGKRVTENGTTPHERGIAAASPTPGNAANQDGDGANGVFSLIKPTADNGLHPLRANDIVITRGFDNANYNGSWTVLKNREVSGRNRIGVTARGRTGTAITAAAAADDAQILYYVGHRCDQSSGGAAKGHITDINDGGSGRVELEFSAIGTDPVFPQIVEGQYIYFKTNGVTAPSDGAAEVVKLDGLMRVVRSTIVSTGTNEGVQTLVCDKLENEGIDFTKFTGNAPNGPPSNGEIDIFVGNFIRNVNRNGDDWYDTPGLIEAHYPGLEHDDGRREYARGLVGDAVSIGINATDLINASWSFIGTDVFPKLSDNVQPDGTQNYLDSGTDREIGTTTAVFDATNSVIRKRLRAVDPTNDTPRDLVEVVVAANVSISNNLTPQKAVGTLGAEFQNVGTLDVVTQVSGILSNPEYTQLLRDADSASFELGLQNNECGIVIDIPQMLLQGGDKQFPQNEAISINLVGQAFRDPIFGTSIGITIFPYLPE